MSLRPALLGLLALVACARRAPAPQLPLESERVLVEGVGLRTPAGALHDEVRDVYLVSNVNGSPVELDDNGFISRLSPEGQVLELKWIDGAREDVTLHAPKGMALRGDTLLVADVDTVRLFDARSGAPTGALPIPGATWLGDVAVDGEGNAYVTDSGLRAGPTGVEPSGSDAVYRIGPDNGLVPLALSAGLDRPSAVALQDGRVLVVTFGADRLYAVAAGRVHEQPHLPAGTLDGLVVLPEGGLLVSSWESGSVWQRAPDGTTRQVGGPLPEPADIAFDARRRRVLVPLFSADALVFLPLPGQAAP